MLVVKDNPVLLMVRSTFFARGLLYCSINRIKCKGLRLFHPTYQKTIYYITSYIMVVAPKSGVKAGWFRWIDYDAYE